MNYRIVRLGLLAALLSLTGCHPLKTLRSGGRSCHKAQAYAKATSIAPLKVPAGLDAPDTSNALHVPTLNEPPPPPRSGKDPCLDEPPSFRLPKPAPPQA